MEQSPLTRQAPPDVFEPKIVGLYKKLFRPEGFWTELFLLKPDIPRLREILKNTDADSLLHIQLHTQQLLLQAISTIKAGNSPSDENALDTLIVFSAVVLAKKYTNPSSDVIEVLAGLDNVDVVFADLVSTLDSVIRAELQQRAVRAATAIVSGGYQTALVSYFVQRDLFPALMKLVHQLDNPLQACEPLLLVGLLANYNKFEIHNHYRVRFSDFINDEAIKAAIDSVAWTCTLLRELYIGIQDDTPASWSIGNTLSYVGLGALTGRKAAPPTLTEEQQRLLLLEQPGLEAASLLTLYDFVVANKLYSHHFITSVPPAQGHTTPFSMFISFNSYLYQHAYRTQRASVYAYLTSLILLILVEDVTTAKLLCETSATVRLCKQRPPYLPLSKGDRPYAAAILDLLTDGINHNLRKRLDTSFYLQSVTVLSRLLSYLAKSRTKLRHHWPELWRSLLSFVRFLNSYSDDIKVLYRTPDMIDSLVDLLIVALTLGESFLPDAAAYDDLFYKLVESGDALTNLRDTYSVSSADDQTSHINTLIAVSTHYKELIDEQQSQREHLSPMEVNKIIKRGYETLSIEAKQGLDSLEQFREAGHKTALKRVARVAVADAAALVAK